MPMFKDDGETTTLFLFNQIIAGEVAGRMPSEVFHIRAVVPSQHQV
jgi:hypothetical protein